MVEADVADHASFSIEDGVLTFTNSPSYEDDSVEVSGSPYTNDEKTYRVVVQASDGGTADEQLSWFKVAVTVTDVEEDGEVSWTVDHDDDADTHAAKTPRLMQFQTGASLMASVTDDDGTPVVIGWQWYRSSSKTSMGTMIAGATEAEYTATDSGDPPDTSGDDRGKYIHVKATYTVDGGDQETASLASDYPVQAKRVEGNTVPAFSATAISRRVVEGASGRTVGAPVTATDADNDVLNYTIAENDNFSIDQATGQIKTKATLDFETPTDTGTDNTYDVTVTATDSAGEASDPTVTVTITVTDVNEAPTFTAGTVGMAADHAEATDGLRVDDPNTPAIDDTYTATDPEGGTVTLSLSGDDSDMFELTDPDPVARRLQGALLQGEAGLRDAGGQEQVQHLRGDGRGLRRRDDTADAVRDRQGRRHRRGGRGGVVVAGRADRG